MLPRNDPDRIQIAFDDHRLVANAGLLLPLTLAQHLGLRELVDNHVHLGAAPGRANAGDKMLTLVASAPRFRGTTSQRRDANRTTACTTAARRQATSRELGTKTKTVAAGRRNPVKIAGQRSWFPDGSRNRPWPTHG